MTRRFIRCIAMAAMALLAWDAHAEYPDHPLRIIVPFGAGSSTDLIARMVAKQLGADTGQSVIVDDRPGAEGSIGMRDGARSPADGYTAIFTTSSAVILNPSLYNTLSYDPVKDFVPVTTLAQFSLLMNVNVKAKFQSVGELLAAAKASPGTITFSSGSAATRLGGELLQQLTGVKLLHVPYKSNAAALNDVMTGQVDLMFIDYPTTLPFMSLGVHPIAVSGPARIAQLPNVPTVQEAGVKGFEVTGWYGVYLPAKTPPAIAARLADLIEKAMKTPEAKEFLARNSTSAYLVKGADLARLQAEQTAHWAQVIQSAHIPKQ